MIRIQISFYLLLVILCFIYNKRHLEFLFRIVLWIILIFLYQFLVTCHVLYFLTQTFLLFQVTTFYLFYFINANFFLLFQIFNFLFQIFPFFIQSLIFLRTLKDFLAHLFTVDSKSWVALLDHLKNLLIFITMFVWLDMLIVRLHQHTCCKLNI